MPKKTSYPYYQHGFCYNDAETVQDLNKCTKNLPDPLPSCTGVMMKMTPLWYADVYIE